MPARTLRTIAVVAVCLSDGAFAADRHSLVDPAAHYKANRLSSPRSSQPILNIPGQTTVLTRQVLDDMNATSVRDALRSTAGVTVGR
jgi:outer membrane receptor for monomeric catechols